MDVISVEWWCFKFLFTYHRSQSGFLGVRARVFRPTGSSAVCSNGAVVGTVVVAILFLFYPREVERLQELFANSAVSFREGRRPSASSNFEYCLMTSFRNPILCLIFVFEPFRERARERDTSNGRSVGRHRVTRACAGCKGTLQHKSA